MSVPLSEYVERPLRAAAPAIYEALAEALKEYHIHPHDIEATSILKAKGLELRLRYGDRFNQSAETFVINEQLERPNEEVRQFFKEIVKKCKQQLTADYYKMMKP